MNIGLYFGSFNPVHIGHLIVANTMLDHTPMDEIWFVVSPHNPHKSKKSLLHAFDRYDMVELAVQDNPKLKVSDIEFHLSQPSYTIKTLTVLAEKYPRYHFSLIMGSDNLKHFHKWKNFEQILAYYTLYIYPRPDTSTSSLDQHPSVHFIHVPVLDLSATFIRKCIQEDKSIQYLVPDNVAELIKRKKFYL